MTPAMSDVLETAELVARILSFLPWMDVVRMAKMNHIWRMNAQSNIAISIAGVIEHFIESGDHDSFWQLLHTTNSAICCELPLLLLLHYPAVPAPTVPVLDLITPNGQCTTFEDFFLELGYDLVPSLPAELDIVLTAGRETRSVLKKTMNVDNIWICIRQSAAPDVLHFLLTERTTAEMNIITAGSVISMYPSLTLKREFFENEILRTHADSQKLEVIHNSHGLIQAVHEHNPENIRLPCGPMRKYTWRNSVRMAGTGRFIWKPKLDQKIALINYKWRLTEKCSNAFCANYMLPACDNIYGDMHAADVKKYLENSAVLSASLFVMCEDNKVINSATTGLLYLERYLTDLCDWFDLGDPAILQKAMDTCNAVISGSCALLALYPRMFAPNDLDFYMSAIDDHDTMRRFLAGRGYALVLESIELGNDIYCSRLIASMETFHHEKLNCRIHIVYASSFSPIGPIVDFDSTLLMNYVSAKNIVCLYPLMTAKKMGKRLARHDKALQLFTKYRERGFRLMPQSLWERESVHYDRTNHLESFILTVPTMPSSQNFADPSWVLPFLPADGDAEDYQPGFWFEDRDDFVWVETLGSI